MCVVFVLVLCCVRTWAQRDPTLSREFQDRDENPSLFLQGRPPPLDQENLDQFPVLTDISEHPDMLVTSGYEALPRPIIVQSPGFPNIPENTGMPPQGRPPLFDQSPDIPGMPEHPQGRPPPSGQSSDIPGMPEHPQGRPPAFDQSSDIPGMPEHPQGRPPPFGQSSDIPGMPEHPQGRPPPFDQSPDIPGMPEHPQGRPPPFNKSSDIPGMQEHHTDLNDTVKHAGVPTNLSVVALPLEYSDHELQLNVSWLPSSGVPAKGYSVEVKSVTNTTDCKSQICYQPDILENVTWVLVPLSWNSVTGGCAIRPGCAYFVKLNADPWDGKTAANLIKELGECEAGVCSCAHRPRLPVPVVSTETVTFNNTLCSNVSWTLPRPSQPQRLPARLRKQSYIVALNSQMPTQVNTTKKIFTMLPNPFQFNTSGRVFEGDTPHWHLLPIPLELAHKVNLLAKVHLVDERGCLGPAGNATVSVPVPVEDAKLPSKSKLSFGVYAILGALIGASAMGAVFVLSARVVKRVLKSFRPAPVSAPLEPLRRRPAWFPLQLRT